MPDPNHTVIIKGMVTRFYSPYTDEEAVALIRTHVLDGGPLQNSQFARNMANKKGGPEAFSPTQMEWVHRMVNSA